MGRRGPQPCSWQELKRRGSWRWQQRKTEEESAVRCKALKIPDFSTLWVSQAVAWAAKNCWMDFDDLAKITEVPREKLDQFVVGNVTVLTVDELDTLAHHVGLDIKLQDLWTD